MVTVAGLAGGWYGSGGCRMGWPGGFTARNRGVKPALEGLGQQGQDPVDGLLYRQFAGVQT